MKKSESPFFFFWGEPTCGTYAFCFLLAFTLLLFFLFFEAAGAASDDDEAEEDDLKELLNGNGLLVLLKLAALALTEAT